MKCMVYHLMLAVGFLSCWTLPEAHATNRTVTNLNDSGANSLRDIILLSVDGDTIDFAVAGTIVLTSGALTIGRDITITGPGPGSLTIQRSSAGGTPEFRIFTISDGTTAGPTVTISGLTITNGKVSGSAIAGRGGGVLVDHARLTLNNCVLTNNHASDSTVNGGRGGAIYNFVNTISLLASVTLTNCTLTGNTATSGGGAICNHAPFGLAKLDLTNCTLNGNSGAGGGGGAIHSHAEGNPGTGSQAMVDVRLRSCTLNGNDSFLGGAIRSSTQSTVGQTYLSLVQCTLSQNNAGFGGAQGGAIHHQSFANGLMELVNCTISGNSAGNGGGVFARGGENPGSTFDTRVFNTIMAGNTASAAANGQDILLETNAIITSQGHNLIGKTDGSSGWVASDLTGTNAAPLNPLLDILQSNGGPTQTHGLLPGSAAINAADDSVTMPPYSLTTDQRGPGFPRLLGPHVDIGAYEGVIEPPLVVNTVSDVDDGVCSAAHCTLREAINAANASSGRTIIFASGLSGTIQLGSSLPQLAANMIVQGPGANVLTVRRNAAFDYRIFLIGNNTSSGPTVTISGLTIANGRTPSGSFPQNSGGGILSSYASTTISNCVVTGNSSPNFGQFGGGIFNYEGALIVNNSTVSGNSAFDGGGIGNYRTTSGTASLTVNHSTLSGNMATGGNGGALHNAAINSGSIAATTFANCTLTGNQSSGAFGGNGGAIYNSGQSSASGIVTLTRCTLNNNSASSGGGISNISSTGSAQTILGGSILKSDGASPNIVNSGGTVTSQGYNLSNDNGGGFLTRPSDQISTEPLLGPLQNNGGPTFTHALLLGSPAIDKGVSSGLTTDQRGVGYLRTIDDLSIANAAGGDGTDIGAFEFGAGFNAVSRKTHGATPFDVILPLIGNPGVECRRNTGADTSGPNVGRDHQVIVTFPGAVIVGGASVTSNDAADSPTATYSVSSNVVTVYLHNIPNAPRRLTINLLNASDGTTTNNVSVPMGVLLGDTSGNTLVNSTDVSQVQAQSGQGVTSSNFRKDVNANGLINSTDVSTVQSKSGTGLP